MGALTMTLDISLNRNDKRGILKKENRNIIYAILVALGAHIIGIVITFVLMRFFALVEVKSMHKPFFYLIGMVGILLFGGPLMMHTFPSRIVKRKALKSIIKLELVKNPLDETRHQFYSMLQNISLTIGLSIVFLSFFLISLTRHGILSIFMTTAEINKLFSNTSNLSTVFLILLLSFIILTWSRLVLTNIEKDIKNSYSHLLDDLSIIPDEFFEILKETFKKRLQVSWLLGTMVAAIYLFVLLFFFQFVPLPETIFYPFAIFLIVVGILIWIYHILFACQNSRLTKASLEKIKLKEGTS